MKAKDWIARLLPLAQDDSLAEAYVQAVKELTDECAEIFKMRVKNIGTDWRRGSDDRMIAAFREASVKWDAVVHGVQMGLQKNMAPFPLLRGALLLPHLTALLEDIQEKRIEHRKARAMQQFLMEAARQLGWNKYLYISSLFDMLENKLQNGASAQLHGYAQSLQDYRYLRGRQVLGETLNHAELSHLQGLERWLIDNRRETMAEMNNLSPRQKLATLLAMGALFA